MVKDSSGDVSSTRVWIQLDIEIVGNYEVVHHRLQDFVDLTFGGDQSNLLQSFDGVVLSLTFP